MAEGSATVANPNRADILALFKRKDIYFALASSPFWWC